MRFTDKAGKHKDKAGNDCPSLAFKVTKRGCGGIYTDTAACIECGQEFEVVEKKLRKKP
jgi:ferredoxin-like protein FixX